MQELITEEIAKRVPPLYANDGKGLDAIAKVHLFSCLSNWDWYMSEYDPDTKTGYGLVIGFEEELGYFSLDEMQEINNSYGFNFIERDEHFTERPLREMSRR